MLGLCFHYESRFVRREHWSWVADWFAVDSLWEIDRPVDAVKDTRFLPVPIESIEQAPSIPLIVAAPQSGRNVQGDTCIDDLEHPRDAIYYFGHDHLNMEPVERPHQVVFVPSAKQEFYAAFAAAIILNDRRVKHAYS